MDVVLPSGHTGSTIAENMSYFFFSVPRIVLQSWFINHKRELFILYYLPIILLEQRHCYFIYQASVQVAF